MKHGTDIKKLEVFFRFLCPLHNLYSCPNIIKMIKPRRMRWAGHVGRMGRRRMHIGYWWESEKERGLG
jgi:hypothetical protein